MPVCVLLVDDHEVVREGLRSLLDSEPDIEVIGCVGDGRAAVKEAERIKPDVVVMDISMPGMSGIAATEEIHKHHPEMHILCLSIHRSTSCVRAVLGAGALGYLRKDCAGTELVAAVRTVAGGEPYLSRDVTS